MVRFGSGCWPVLVDESGAGGGSVDPMVWPDRCDVVGVVGSSLVDTAMGPLGVVVLDVFLEEASELVFVPDDGPVQEFVAQSPYPSFGVSVCLGRPWWCADCGDVWTRRGRCRKGG